MNLINTALRVLCVIFLCFPVYSQTATSFQWQILEHEDARSNDQQWQNSPAFIVLTPRQQLKLNIPAQTDTLFLSLQTTQLQLDTSESKDRPKLILPSVYQLHADTPYLLTFDSEYPTIIEPVLLTSQQLLQQQAVFNWLILLPLTLILLALFSIVSSQQQTTYAWLVCLLLSSACFITLSTGLIGQLIPVSQLATSSVYSLFACLVAVSLLGYSKALFLTTASERNKRCRQVLNLLLIGYLFVGVWGFWLSPKSGYLLASSGLLLASVVGCLIYLTVGKKVEQTATNKLFKAQGITWLLLITTSGLLVTAYFIALPVKVTYWLAWMLTLHAMISVFVRVHLDKQSASTGTLAGNDSRQSNSLQQMALCDGLTGLPNQMTLDRFIQTHIEQQPSKNFALVEFKLKNVEQINLTLGYQTGDIVIVQTARRLNQLLLQQQGVIAISREQDAALVAISGVRFAFLVEYEGQVALLEYLAKEMRRNMPEPAAIDGVVIENQLVFGAAIYPQHGERLTNLLNHAQIALDYGISSYQLLTVFSPEHEPISQAQRELAAELKLAIEQEQLELMVHPVVEVNTRSIVAAEVLIRWHHPTRGLIAPADFIELAERTGIIYSITRWVLIRAIDELAQWRKANIDIQLSVNLSNRDLLQHELVDVIVEQLASHQIPVDKLVLEINEQALLADEQTAHDMLMRLNDLGIHAVIDDFGSGLSAVGLLRRLPLQAVKIDQELVKSLSEGDTARIIANTVIDIGRNMGLDVIAEGVEDKDIEIKLRSMGCSLAQGFLYSQPIELAGFASWYQHWLAKRGS